MTEIWNTRQRILYSFGQLGNGAYNGFNNAILSLYVSAFTSNPFIIGYLGSTRTMEGVVIQPLVGRWSDRTTSRLGRRRPFILFGVPLAVFFLALVPIFGHGPRALALPGIAASIILFSIMWNTAGDPYQSLMVDITPPRERSTYNAILSVLALLGQVVILLFATHVVKKNDIPNSIFYACIIILFLTFAVVFLGVREPKVAASVAQVENKLPLREYVAEMRVFKEAFKLLVSIFFLWTGLNAILPFLTIFPKKIVHASNAQSITIYLVLILAGAVCAYPFGRLAQRYGNRALILVGTVLLIVAALLGLIVPSYFWLFPLAILAGAGFSATTALTYPYLSLLVPGSKIGVFTGLQTAFSAVAAPIGIGLTGLLIDHFGYRSIFAMLAVMMVFDVFFLLSVDEAAAQRQVARVEEQERLVAAQTAALPAV